MRWLKGPNFEDTTNKQPSLWRGFTNQSSACLGQCQSLQSIRGLECVPRHTQPRSIIPTFIIASYLKYLQLANKMHLLVLGATGKSGAYGLKYALEEG